MSVVAFAAGGYGFLKARSNAHEFRRTICAAENSTRLGVRDMLDLAFQPSIDKQTSPDALKALVKFRESLKKPVAALPCNKLVNP